MRIIGVTGGVGAGKSTVLKMLEDMVSCIVIRTDEVAKETTLPGGEAYKDIVKLLGTDILQADGCIDRKKMAARIFRITCCAPRWMRLFIRLPDRKL